MAALQKLLALVNGRLAQISPAQTSAGAASAGLVPALGGAGGELDWSMLPDNFQTLSGGVTPGTKLGYANALDTFNLNNGSENVGNLNGWRNYWLYRWRGPRKITSVSVYVNSTGTNTFGLGLMSIGATSLTLIETITTNGISDAATGPVTLVAGVDFTSFNLPQGDYVMQMVYAVHGGGGSFINQSSRTIANGPNFGWNNGTLPVAGFIDSAGASTLAASFSGTPNGGLQNSKVFPKIWMNGTN